MRKTPGREDHPARQIGAATWLVVATLLLSNCASAFSQQPAVQPGVVTDVSGAVIPGATITAKPAQGGIATTATTDGQGAFQLAGLIPGDYVVTATATGFAPIHQQVTVVPLTADLHLTLNIAQASETVAVNATSAAIETSSTATGNTL